MARSKNFLDFSCRRHLISFDVWIFTHIIWSHCVAASLGNCSLHPNVTTVCVISSHLIPSPLISTCAFSPFLRPPHLITAPLISSHVTQAFLSFSSTQLVSTRLVLALHRSSHVRSSQLIPSHLISACLSLLRFSRLFSALRSSCQLISHVLISSPSLTSSKLFSGFLTSSHLVSLLLTSSQRTLRSPQLFSGFVHLCENRTSVQKPQKDTKSTIFKAVSKPT